MSKVYHESKPIPSSSHISTWKSLLKQGLDDDGWEWDWTALGTLRKGDRPVKAKLIAKSEGVWAAAGLLPAAELLSAELGAPIRLSSNLSDGDSISRRQTLVEWVGPSAMVLAVERPFINLSSYACGIASATRRLVEIVNSSWRGKGKPPRVIPTRKTLPGYRDVAVQAVRAGGGFSHRISLSGGVLIKENHIASIGGISQAIEGARAVAPHGLKIEIEVRDLKELAEALKAGAEGVLLDNFTPDLVRRAVVLVAKSKNPPFIEVSGGLSESNVADYAIEGVHLLSFGSLTHSVKSLDFSLLVSP